MSERRIILKSARELDFMRQANRIVADTLVLLADSAVAGMTTRQLDKIAEEYILSQGGKPSFPLVNFDGSACISVNEQIVHGMPGARVVQNGDIVSFDLGVVYKGWHGDAAFTVAVGDISPIAQKLLDATTRSLAHAIAKVRPGAHVSDIGGAVEDLAIPLGYGLVRQYSGHGIGRSMHEEPQVLNYRPAASGRGVVLRPGMVLAIEPMLNVGGDDTVVLDDGWTVVTKDGSLSAHFEHSVAITEQGYEILSRPSDPSRMWGDPAQYGLEGSAVMEKLG